MAPTRSDGALDLSRIRHPLERRVLFLSALANLALVGAAITVVLLAPEWLHAHPRAATVVARIRGALVVVLVFVPGLAFVRRGRWVFYRENSVRVASDQLPELFEVLVAHCQALGLPPTTELRLAQPLTSLSAALALHGGTTVVVLGAGLFSGLDVLEERLDVLSFVIAQELARIRLGHTSWAQELLLGYLKRIPLLRMPLLMVQTFSRDRVAATLAPDGVRGLLYQASGGDILAHLDVASYLREVMASAPTWWAALLSVAGREGPNVSARVREIYRARFFPLDRDLARFGATTPSGVRAP
jgi:hypothetical protein